MTKRLLLRRDARQDVDAATSYYLEEGGTPLADAFVRALEAGFDRIRASPGAGSPRYAEIMAIADMRSLRLRRFPYLLFYSEHDDHIELWRVLHARRDIPAFLSAISPLDS